MNAPENDDALVRRAAGGDDDAFAEFVRRHSDRVRTLCASVLRGRDDADDAAQDAFLKAYRGLRKFSGESSFGTWVHRVAVNVCLDRLRAAARRRLEPLEALDPADAKALVSALAEPGPSGPLENRDLAERLLARLTPEQRVALALRETQGLSYAEIARELSCSLDAVKARLKRARRELLLGARHFLGKDAV